jgi:hypothetical protein
VAAFAVVATSTTAAQQPSTTKHAMESYGYRFDTPGHFVIGRDLDVY